MAAKKRTGPRAIDLARKDHHTHVRSIVVPEWDDLELFFGPVTVADMESIEARKPRSDYEKQLYLIIHKARDEQGAPLFEFGDLKLMRDEVSITIWTRIIQFMSATMLTKKEADQEVEADPTSADASR